MRILYISPYNSASPQIFPPLKETFWENGHTETSNANEATHCFVELHCGDLKYPEIPNNIPIVYFDNTEYSSWIEKEKREYHENAVAVFMRNMDRFESYPSYVHPYDWPYFKGCDYTPVAKEDLCSRPYDICFSGTMSNVRRKVIDAIAKDGRLKILVDERNHDQRYNTYQEWVNFHRQAKLYLNCDGAGYTNERQLQLFAVAPMLKNKNNHKASNPFTDCINCIEINEQPTSEDIEKVRDILSVEGWLYDIYRNAINFTKKNLSYEGRANYVLNILKQ